MKPRPFDYIRPDTIEEAVALLAEYGEGARVLAGGQSLVPMLNLRIVEAEALIDVSRIGALDVIRDRGDTIEIGAAVTQNTLRNILFWSLRSAASRGEPMAVISAAMLSGSKPRPSAAIILAASSISLSSK